MLTEMEIREQIKLVLKHLEAENLEEAQNIIVQNKEILQYNLDLPRFVPLLPRIRYSKTIPKNINALRMVIDTAYEIYVAENNVNELLFFAAAKCDLPKLEYCIKNCSDINQTREGDNVLMFIIKFGNLVHPDCPECFKMVVDAGVDLHRKDYFLHDAHTILSTLHDKCVRKGKETSILFKNLEKILNIFSKTSEDICGNETLETKLFKSLTNNDENSFAQLLSTQNVEVLDSDDGNSTLLQLCCQKGFKESVGLLIKLGADVTKTTTRNQQTPLEISARRNYEEIFDMLLATKKIQIEKELFVTFLRNRPKHIKSRYFDKILKYKGLNVEIESSSGNTPLHYAVIFSNTDAVRVLLERGASLTVKNNSEKSVLDYISLEDLENHFDKCLLLDEYNDVGSGKYELCLNYQSLIEDSELTIISKISNTYKLRPLLNHPLISTFVDIKWKLAKSLYKKLFVFQMLFYLATMIVLVNPSVFKYFSVFLSGIYSLRIALTFNWKNNKCQEMVHMGIVTCLLLLNFVNSCYQTMTLWIIVLDTISCHLFWQFNPSFATFHSLLTSISVYGFSYLFYFVGLTFFTGTAYYIHLFSILDYNTSTQFDLNFLQNVIFFISQFNILFVFGIVISFMTLLTIFNSVPFLQESLSLLVQNNTGLNHTLIFLENVERFYLKFGYISNPLLFKKNSISTGKKLKDKYVHFKLNLNKFASEKLFFVELDKKTVDKIKKFVVKRQS